MDLDAVVTTILRGKQRERSLRSFYVDVLLCVRGLESTLIRHNPNLQKVHRLNFRVIEFAVGDASSGSHHLNLAGPDDRACTHAVLVCERALEHVRENFHVPMTMSSESCARNDAVVVEHP